MSHGLRTRYCEHCGKPIHIHTSDISRGKGMYCCKSCAAKNQQTIKYLRNCAICNVQFKTSKTECTTCSEDHP